MDFLDNDLLNDDFAINDNITSKYFQIKNKLDSYENFLLEFYSREIIDNIKNNYKTFLLSDIKAYSKLSTIYQNFLTIFDEYQNFLDTKPLKNFDETKLYIDNKIKHNFDEIKLYIDEKIINIEDKIKLYIDEKIINIKDKIINIDDKIINIEEKIIVLLDKLHNYYDKYSMLIYYFFAIKIFVNNHYINTNIQIYNLDRFNSIKKKSFSILTKILDEKPVTLCVHVSQSAAYGNETKNTYKLTNMKFSFKSKCEINNEISNKISSNIINMPHDIGLKIDLYYISQILFSNNNTSPTYFFQSLFMCCSELYDLIIYCEKINIHDNIFVSLLKNIKDNNCSLYDLYMNESK